MIRHISSRSNVRIKSLLSERQNDLFFEGEKLVRDLLRRKIPIQTLIVHRSHESEMKTRIQQVEEMWLVTPNVLEKLTLLKEKSDFMALVRYRPDKVNLEKESLILALDSVQDPGNAGTIFRCAAAFGINAVVFCGECVRPSNPKFLRAAQTAIFDVRFEQIPRLSDLIAQALLHNLNIYLTSPRPPKNPLPIKDIQSPALIVLGNEGRGLPPGMLDQFPVVTIEQKKHLESLNVGISACLLMHELVIHGGGGFKKK